MECEIDTTVECNLCYIQINVQMYIYNDYNIAK